jgi:6-phosphogluconate dehydrogenase (decarboxylating)
MRYCKINKGWKKGNVRSSQLMKKRDVAFLGKKECCWIAGALQKSYLGAWKLQQATTIISR